MTEKNTKELTVKEKEEVTVHAEQAKPGPVFTPAVDIYEKDEALVLLADLPGVAPENLTIDLQENTLTLTGEVDAGGAEEGCPLMTEYGVGKYYRQFSLSDAIDQEGIDATLADGVLKLTLPKVSRALPRKITIQAA